jgi:hypothetical protein
MDMSVPVRNICAPGALITGVLALLEIKRLGGIEKSKMLAWAGVVLGAGWVIFGLLVGITFLLAESFH